MKYFYGKNYFNMNFPTLIFWFPKINLESIKIYYYIDRV